MSSCVRFTFSLNQRTRELITTYSRRTLPSLGRHHQPSCTARARQEQVQDHHRHRAHRQMSSLRVHPKGSRAGTAWGCRASARRRLDDVRQISPSSQNSFAHDRRRSRPETEAPICRYIADNVGIVVVAPDYRKAPSALIDMVLSGFRKAHTQS